MIDILFPQTPPALSGARTVRRLDRREGGKEPKPPRVILGPEERRRRKQIATAEWKARNRERNNAKRREWYQRNSEKVKAQNREWYARHREQNMKQCPTCRRPLTFSKTHEQRKKFHALCGDIGQEIGLTPGQVKAAIKQEYYGLDEFKMGDKWYRIVQSSEDSDRMDYSRLIDFAYQWAAENGIAISDPV